MAEPAFTWYKCTGTNAATETDCAFHPCWLNTDIHSVDTPSYPVSAPQESGQYNYSMEYVLRGKLTAAAPNYVENVKVSGPAYQPDVDLDPANKITVMWGRTDTPTTPVDTASSIATTSQHDNYYQEGNALALTDPGTQLVLNDFLDYWLYSQIKVAYGAVAGTLPFVTFDLWYEVS